MSISIDPQIEETCAGRIVCPPWCEGAGGATLHYCDVIDLDGILAAAGDSSCQSPLGVGVYT